MSGLGLILSIARDALAAQRYALDVTAHNIANVNTPGYSRQSPVYEARQPASYGGLSLGRGVDIDQVVRTIDQFVEDRLMQQKSSMLSSKEMENYIKILEGFFNENSETSISTMLSDFWNLWHDISNNPSGASERIVLYEHSISLSEQFNTLDADLTQLETDLTSAVSAGIDEINQITDDIAQLNDQIVGTQTGGIANDLMDKRNTLVSELSEYIDVKTFEQDNGSLTVVAARGCILVHENSSYDLELGGDNGDRVKWQGSGNTTVDITDYITKGKLDGWLDMRDEVIAKYKLDLDALAKEFIWAVNQQHSQGVGLKLFSTEVTGTYKTDSSGLLSTLAYGNKIDYTKDFKMWIEDSSVTPGTFSAVTVDMGISGAAVTSWAGAATGATEYEYVFTVTTGGTVGADVNVTEANGAGLGVAKTGADVSTALDTAIAGPQTITVTGGGYGTQTIEIEDSGGDAERSASSIADALNNLNGVTAYASSVQVEIAGISKAPSSLDGNEGDELSFTLKVGSETDAVSFLIGYDEATTQHNFEDALQSAINTINTSNGNNDISLTGTGASRTITSTSGETIGIENVTYTDNAVVAFGDFDLGPTAVGDTISFDLADNDAGLNPIAVSFVKGADATGDSGNLYSALTGGATASALATAGYTFRLDSVNDRVIITRSGGQQFAVDNFQDAGATDATANVYIQEAGSTTLDGLGATVPLTEGVDDDALAAAVDDVNRSITFKGVTVTEGGANDSAAIAGTVTVLLEPGLAIQSNVDGTGAAGGLFNVAADTDATLGKSIITLGGDGGFSGFSAGDTISFEVDGNLVDYTIGAEVTDVEFATGLQAQLVNDLAADIPGTYSIIRNGASVSILKKTDTPPIEITSFDDTGGSNATLSVSTGTGTGTANPDNVLLDAGDATKTSATSTLYGSEEVISWVQYNATGTATGTSGTISVDDADPFTVDGLTFNIGAGTLVAGNTFTINTKDDGSPDKLVLAPASGTKAANSVSDTYTFNVTTGGTIGSDTLVIDWSNSVTFGTITITPSESDYTVDGMTLTFTSGTLFAGDRFTITTDENGAVPNNLPNLPSSWHWTLESFKDEFNNQATGVTASVTSDDALKFSPGSNYSFGFSDDTAQDSGLMAALGINTLFEGEGTGSIGINSQIANKDYIAAAQIDGDTGNFAVGDNTNALAIADLQYDSQNIALWTSSRGSAKSSANVTATLEGYYHSIVGSIGTTSASISRSRSFDEVMANKLGEMRDSISAVSLDEEMTNLIKFQHAYAAAAKLISVSDEMFNTLLSVR